MKTITHIILFLLVFSYITLFAQNTVIEEWIYRYNGTDSLADVASAIDARGCIVMVGSTHSATQGKNFIMQRYSLSGLLLASATYNGPDNGNDVAVTVKTDNNCNIIVTGYSWSASGQEDWLTLTFDSLLNIQHEVRYDGTANDNDRPSAMVLDANGNIFITGYSTGIGTAYDYTTIMYNSQGSQQWVIHYDGGSGLNDISKTIVLSGSEVIIAGYSTDSLTNRDFATVKYDITGTELWISRYTSAGSKPDEATDIDIDAQGNIYVCGFNYTLIDHDYATIKYSPAGVEQWVRKYNSGYQDQAFAIVVNKATSEVYVTGWNFTLASHDIATVKYDSSGTQLWVKKYDGSASAEDGANDIAIDDSGYVYVCGFSKGIGTDYDFVTLKLTPAGDTAWVMRYNRADSTSDVATALALDKNNNVYVTGSIMGGVTIVDIVTIKYNQFPTLSLSFNVTDESCPGAEDGAIDLTVSNGVPPYTYSWSNWQTTEDISHLPAGGYFVIVTDSNNRTATGTVVLSALPPDSATSANLPPPCSELFISEYTEGQAHDRAIEIYNPSNDTMALNRYFLRVFMNGAPTPLIAQLVGVLLPHKTHVIAHPNASSPIYSLAQQTSNKLTFDGDDALQLIKVNNSWIPNVDSIEGIGQNPHAIFDTLQLDTLDQLGIPGVDPGNQGFPVTGGTTKNSTLIRNASVTSGMTDWGCGQKQWKTMPPDSTSNLGKHKSICKKSGMEIYYSFENPILFDDTITIKKYLEFDIYVSSNTNFSFLHGTCLYLTYDTIAFGTKISSNNKISLSNLNGFNTTTYYDPMAITADFANNGIRLCITTDISATPLNRVNITTTPVPMVHVKLEIKQCNVNSNIKWNDFSPTYTEATYYLVPDTPISSGFLGYDLEISQNDLNVLLCQLDIHQFTSPVYPGTYYPGTTDNKWLMEIQGIGFGSTRGNGNVWFVNANDPNNSDPLKKYTPIDSKDFISWGDSIIKIKMPSYIDSLPFQNRFPSSGQFYIKTNASDSVMSDTPVEMPYGIINSKYLNAKKRWDLTNASDPNMIKFKLSTTITNHPDTMVELAARKAVRDWACFTQVNFIIDGETSLNTSDSDGVSVITFANSLSNPFALAETQPRGDACYESNGDIVIFPIEIDIALLYDPGTLPYKNGPWHFDTAGSLPPDKNDFSTVITHEVGHATLLTHVNNLQDLMYPFVQYDSVDYILFGSRRWIADDDFNGGMDVMNRSLSIVLVQPCNAEPATQIPPQYACISGIKEKTNKQNFITVFPNPFQNGFTVAYNIDANNTLARFIVYDYSGKEVKFINKKIETRGIYSEYINMSSMANSIYLLVIYLDNAKYNYKIIKWK